MDLWSLLPWLIAGWLSGRVISFLTDPNQIPGLPLLGHVIALGRHGVAFLNCARRKYGDVFTIGLAGKSMTFLHDARMLDAFFSTPDSHITFRPAVEQFTQRVYGLPSKEFFPRHADILKDLRHLLVPGELGVHAARLAERVRTLTGDLFPEGQQVELFAATRSLVFRSAVEALFGPELFKCMPGGAAVSEERFFRFDDGFELAASPVPHVFQPRFTSARSDLLKWMTSVLQTPGFDSTTAGQLAAKSGLRSALLPNLLLALLWASQANTVPATFWSLAFLLLPDSAGLRAGVLAELRQETAVASGSGGAIAASMAGQASQQEQRQRVVAAASKLSMDRRSLISRCVAEAVRLRSHSIDLRIVAQDVELTASTGTTVRLPKGRLLAICPFESHHDALLYPDAWAFNPDRKPLTLGDGTTVVSSVAGLAFGGGSYRCPGRFFAEMEVALVVQLLLYELNLELVPGPAAAAAAAAVAPAQGNVATDASGQQGDEGSQGLLGAMLDRPLHELLMPVVRQLLGEAGVWGLGLFEPGSDDGASGSTVAATQAEPNGAAAHNSNGAEADADGPVGPPAAEAGPDSSGGEAAADGGSPGLETWRRSGDRAGLLPRCNLHRLVGLKVPAEPCMVSVSRAGA